MNKFSNIFENCEIIEIGPLLEKSELFPFLNNGINFAIFISLGDMPVENEILENVNERFNNLRSNPRKNPHAYVIIDH